LSAARLAAPRPALRSRQLPFLFRDVRMAHQVLEVAAADSVSAEDAGTPQRPRTGPRRPVEEALAANAAAVLELSDWVTSVLSRVGNISKDQLGPLQDMIGHLIRLGSETQDVMAELSRFMPKLLQAKQECAGMVEYKLLPTGKQRVIEWQRLACATISACKWDWETLENLCDRLRRLTNTWAELRSMLESWEKKLQPELERQEGVQANKAHIKKLTGALSFNLVAMSMLKLWEDPSALGETMWFVAKGAMTLLGVSQASMLALAFWTKEGEICSEEQNENGAILSANLEAQSVLQVFVHALNAPGDLRANMDNIKRLVGMLDVLKQRVVAHLAQGKHLRDEVLQEIDEDRRRSQHTPDAEMPVDFLSGLQLDEAQALCDMLSREYASTQATQDKLKEWEKASHNLVSSCEVLQRDIHASLA